MPLGKITDAAVIVLRDKWDRKVLNVRQAADFYDVTPETIRRICRRETYRKVTLHNLSDVTLEAAVTQEIEVISNEEVTRSLEKLRELVQGDKSIPPIVRRPDPMDTGLQDPGEDKVLP